MTPKTFTDSDAIRELSDAILTFKHVYLGNESNRSMVRASQEEKYRGLSPWNKQYYKAVAVLMQDMLDWTSEIDPSLDTGDIGEQTLSDMTEWVLQGASEERRYSCD
jgi:hypothetical protein